MRHPRKLSGRIITWLFHSTFVTPLFFTSADQTTLSIKCGSIFYHFLISLSIHTIRITHLFYLVHRSFFCLLHTLRTDSPPASLKLKKSQVIDSSTIHTVSDLQQSSNLQTNLYYLCEYQRKKPAYS